MKKFILNLVFLGAVVLAFNQWSGKEIIIREKLDNFFTYPGIELNRDCWLRVLQELVLYKNNKNFKDLKMFISKVNMQKGNYIYKIECHALLEYTTPAGNTIYYDPTSNRRAIYRKDDK